MKCSFLSIVPTVYESTIMEKEIDKTQAADPHSVMQGS